MTPVLFLLENPDDVAERLARQWGCLPEEALRQMEYCDCAAIEAFQPGNDFPKGGLN
jgi:hypothetical protein